MCPSNPQYSHRILDSKIAARVASKRESEQARRQAADEYTAALARELGIDSFGNFDPSDALLNHEDDQR
jgi:hypothetical protein